MHGLGDRHKDHTGFFQLLAEGRGHRYRVEYRIHSDTGQCHLLMQRDAQLVVGLQQLRIDLIQALWLVGHALWRGVVRYRLIVDIRVFDVRPVRRFHLQPLAVGLQTPLGQPFRLALFVGDKAHHVFIQTRGQGVRLDVGDKTGFVFAGSNLAFDFDVTGHGDSPG